MQPLQYAAADEGTKLGPPQLVTVPGWGVQQAQNENAQVKKLSKVERELTECPSDLVPELKAGNPPFWCYKSTADTGGSCTGDSGGNALSNVQE